MCQREDVSVRTAFTFMDSAVVESITMKAVLTEAVLVVFDNKEYEITYNYNHKTLHVLKYTNYLKFSPSLTTHNKISIHFSFFFIRAK